jgi:hypothetical protein
VVVVVGGGPDDDPRGEADDRRARHAGRGRGRRRLHVDGLLRTTLPGYESPSRSRAKVTSSVTASDGAPKYNFTLTVWIALLAVSRPRLRVSPLFT